MINIPNNLKSIRKKIPSNVSLVAVSKTKPNTDILAAYNAGQRIFGENKVQELEKKQKELPNDIQWHMIGHLQKNKVKYIAPFVSLIHTVDSIKLIQEIDKRAYQNLDNLVKVQSIQKEIDKGRRLNTQQIKDYTEAKAEYTKRLEEGVLVDALLNESTYQTFTNYGTGGDSDSLDAWRNDEMQRGATKQAIIDYMVDQRFPGSGKYVEKEVEKESQTRAQKIAAYEKRKDREAKQAEAELNRINKAKNEADRRKAVDFYLNRNMKHADDVDKLEIAGKKQQAQELRVKLLNEARGVEKTPFSALQGTIDNEGKFSPSDDSGEYFIVDDKLQLVEGVEDGVGLIDALNSETVYRDLNANYKSEIKSYVTNRMAQRSLSKPSQNKSVANASSLPKAY